MTVLHKSIGFQFDEIIFCVHEDHDLKTQKMEETTKDSKFTYCLLSFQGRIPVYQAQIHPFKIFDKPAPLDY